MRTAAVKQLCRPCQGGSQDGSGLTPNRLQEKYAQSGVPTHMAPCREWFLGADKRFYTAWTQPGHHRHFHFASHQRCTLHESDLSKCNIGSSDDGSNDQKPPDPVCVTISKSRDGKYVTSIGYILRIP
jgi:hypothetical protein